MSKSSREIVESPLEIGIDEIVPYDLTIPASRGTPSSPSIVVKDSDLNTVAGVITTGPTVDGQVISFTMTAATLTLNADYRVEIKYNVTGGTLEDWGTWMVRL